MLSSWTLYVWGPVAAIIYKIVTYCIARERDKVLAQQWGCQRPKDACAKWPLSIDLLFKALQATRRRCLMEFFLDVCEGSGNTFMLNLLGAKCIDTVSPENIEAILSTQFQDFGLGVRKPTFAPLLGSGIFTQDGPAWKHSRELLRPQFSKRRLQNLEAVEEHVSNLISCIKETDETDLQPLFFRFTLDTTTSMLFGRSVSSLENKDSATAEAQFAEAFKIAQDNLHERSRLVNWYWLWDGPEFRQAIRVVHGWLDETIRSALNELKEPGLLDEKPKEEETVLEALMKETRDPQVLRDQTINVLLAGRDSTACCLSWTFRLLLDHPQIFERLSKEVTSAVGSGTTARLPTREDIRKMPYLSCVIKEVLRLYPPVPVNSREVLTDTTLPTGGGAGGTSAVLLRKGEFVGYSVFVMHRRQDLYGPDARLFCPERWEVPEGQPWCLKNIGWAYLPFNGGLRACLGQEYAMRVIEYVVVRLLQELPAMVACEGHAKAQREPSTILQHELTLVLAPAAGCVVRTKEETYEKT